MRAWGMFLGCDRMEKIKSGIPGLDEIMNGGLPKNQLVLVTGTSCTRKTTLGTQFLYNGAKEFNDNSVFLSFEEPVELIKENVKSFGWDLESLEKSGKLAFIKFIDIFFNWRRWFHFFFYTVQSRFQ